MEFEQLQTKMTCEWTENMWKQVEINHEQFSSLNKAILKQQSFNYKINDCDNISKPLNKVEPITQENCDMGEQVTETDKITKVLGSLPRRFK